MRISYNRNKDFKHFSDWVTVLTMSQLLEVAQYNHCMGEYSGGNRFLDGFLGCDAIVMDVGNDNSVYTPADVFMLVPAMCYIVYSRHHMLQKGKVPPRPRFHVYYPLGKIIRDSLEVWRIKNNLCTRCPAFDETVKDTTQLIFGVKQPSGLDLSQDSKYFVEEVLARPRSLREVFIPPDRLAQTPQNWYPHNRQKSAQNQINFDFDEV